MNEKSEVSEPKCKRRKITIRATIEFDDFVRSEGLQFIALAIFRLLDLKTIRICLLVSKRWNNLIENDKKLWSLQLNSFKTSVLRNPLVNEKYRYRRSFEEFYPQFINTFDQLCSEENSITLKTLVLFFEQYIIFASSRKKTRSWYIQSPFYFAMLRDRIDIFEINSRTSMPKWCYESILLRHTDILENKPKVLEFLSLIERKR